VFWVYRILCGAYGVLGVIGTHTNLFRWWYWRWRQCRCNVSNRKKRQ